MRRFDFNDDPLVNEEVRTKVSHTGTVVPHLDRNLRFDPHATFLEFMRQRTPVD